MDSCIGQQCLNYCSCRRPQHPIQKHLREMLAKYPEPDPVGDGPVEIPDGRCPRWPHLEPKIQLPDGYDMETVMGAMRMIANIISTIKPLIEEKKCEPKS